MVLFWALLQVAAGNTLALPAPPSPTPPVTVPLSTFQQWHPGDGRRDYRAAGVTITLAPRRCWPDEMSSDACYLDKGMSNALDLTIRADGLPPIASEVNDAALYFRVALVRLRATDTRPAVVVESNPGGSGGGNVETVFVPEPDGYRRTELTYDTPRGRSNDFTAELADGVADLNGDGRADFVLEDEAFAGSPWYCHACEVSPPMVLSIRDGWTENVSRDPAFAPLFRKHMAETKARCTARDEDAAYRNPACAAYVADAARLGQFAAAWQVMLQSYDRSDRTFVATLRRGLIAGHYLEH